MADINKTIPHILKWEGGFVELKNDKGGATNYGVTISTWKAAGYDKDGDGDIDVDDLKIITIDDFKTIFKKYYWDRWKADQIKNQSIANILVDWCYNSGAWGVRIPQQLLNLKSDGIVGPMTLNAINNHPNQKALFDMIWSARYKFYQKIVNNDASQFIFLKGWLRRLNDITFND